MCATCVVNLAVERERARRKLEDLWLHNQDFKGQHTEGGGCPCHPSKVAPDDTRTEAEILAGVKMHQEGIQ